MIGIQGTPVGLCTSAYCTRSIGRATIFPLGCGVCQGSSSGTASKLRDLCIFEVMLMRFG